MQHYGAPTRLLDFTYSPFVALFFAVETLSEEFAVYQVDLKRLKQLNNNVGVRYSFDFLQKLLDYKSKHPIVVPYEPLLQNERLVSQQGLFLASNSNTESLDKILNSYNANQAFIIKYRFQCHKTEVKRIIGELKKMNIDNFRLFPGIDGLSKAMRHSLLEPSSYIGTSLSKYERVLE